MEDGPAKRLKVLLVEDSPDDARILREMCAELPDPRWAIVQAPGVVAALACLADGKFDVVLLDMGLPDSLGVETVRKVHAAFLALPIIVLTGHDDEATALSALREGAQDYLVKGQVTPPLLSRTVRYAIERQKLIAELKAALAKVKTLSGFIPICASCKKIRDDSGYWQAVEIYVRDRSDAEFSHGICPDCKARLYPDL